MHRLLLPLALLAASSLLFACGGDDGDDGGADAAPVADGGPTDDAEPEPDAEVPLTELDALCADDGPMVTALRQSLGCSPSIAIITVYEPDFFEGDGLANLCRGYFEDYLEDGSITVDESAIPACMASLEGTSCDLVGDPLVFNSEGACADVLVGSYDANETCDISAQCSGDSYCGTTAALFGVVEDCSRCHPRVANGDACMSNEECTSGVCGEADKCIAPRALGQSCTVSNDCEGTLRCDGDSLECVRSIPQVGDACVDDGECGYPSTRLYCDIDGTDTCLAMPAVGEACLEGRNFGCSFIDYQWCDPATELCAAPEISNVGEPCYVEASLGSGALRCAEGLACTDPTSLEEGVPVGVCYTPRTAGQVCMPGFSTTESCELLATECEDGVCVPYTDYTGQCTGEEPPS